MKAWKKGSALLAAILFTVLLSCCGSGKQLHWEPIRSSTQAESTAAPQKGSEATEPVKPPHAPTELSTRSAPVETTLTETSPAETADRAIPAPSTESVPETETGEPKVTYVANTSSKKFHYPDCSSVADMKESNKLYFTGTREELIEQGYQPCKRCNP